MHATGSKGRREGLSEPSSCHSKTEGRAQSSALTFLLIGLAERKFDAYKRHRREDVREQAKVARMLFSNNIFFRDRLFVRCPAL